MKRFFQKLLIRPQPRPVNSALEIYETKAIEFHEFEPLETFHKGHFATERETEAALSRRGGQAAIYRPWSTTAEDVSIATPAMFLDMYNFRESFVDALGLNARQRQLLLSVQSRLEMGQNKVLLFEHKTALHRALTRSGADVTSSHYVENRNDPHFQDMQDLTFNDESFDIVVHSDVLEHVPDYRAALSECKRVLKSGGLLIYTAPFFPIEKSFLRAEHAADGRLIRHLPDEIHGDNLTGGILAYHNFGWDLIEAQKLVGFDQVGVEVCLAPELGLFSTNCPIWTELDPPQPGNMLPIVILGQA